MQHPPAAVRRRRVIAGGCAAFIFAAPAAALADGTHSGQPNSGQEDLLTKLLAPRIAPTTDAPEVC